MQKKFVYAGLVCVLAAVVLFFLPALVTPIVPPQAQQQVMNFTVPALSYNSIAIAANGSSVIEFVVKTSALSNTFLLNQSAFQDWEAASAASPYNGLPAAIALEGSGALLIYNSTLLASFPPIIGSKPAYASASLNSSNYILPAGSYDVVVENANASSQFNATVIYIYGISARMTVGLGAELTADGIAFLLLLVAGIILMVYGAVKGSPAPEVKGGTTDAEVEAIYRSVESDKYKNGKSDKHYKKVKKGGKRRTR